MLKLLFTCLFCFFILSCFAKITTGISGDVSNPEGKKIPHATVELRSSTDSLISLQFTDSLGHFGFANLKNITYVLRVSFVGYKRQQKTIDAASPAENIRFALERDVKTLAEVNVIAHKKFVTMQDDKIIYDVTALPGVNSDNSLEILKKLPGIWVEGESSIRVNGSESITVLLNGKVQTMQTAQVMNLLKTIPGSTLDKIEVITGGSSKYDASGGSVLNIVTKKRKIQGYNISLTNGVAVDRYLGYNGSLFGNAVYKRLQGNVSLGFIDNQSYYTETGNTLYLNNGQPQNAVGYVRNNFSRAYTPNIYTNLSYDLNSKSSLSLDVVSNWNSSNGKLRDSSGYRGMDNFDLFYNNNTKNKERLTSFNLDYNLKTDKAGSNLTLGYGYIDGFSNQTQRFSNASFTPAGNPLELVNILGMVPLDGHQHIGRADFERPFKHSRLEMGLKITSGSIQNNVSYDTVQNNQIFARDFSRSDNLVYIEDIQAGYLTYAYNFKGVSFKGGGRVERTRMQSESELHGTGSDNTFFSFLPSLSISYKRKNLSTILKLTSGLSRPDYRYLNPYVYYISQFKSREGNPDLQPSRRYTVSIDNSLWDFINLSLGYNRINGQIYLVDRQVGTSLNTIQRPENATDLNDYYASLSVSYSLLSSRLQGQINGYGETYNYQIKPQFLTSINNLGQFNFYNFSSSNSYKVSKRLTLEASVFYRSEAKFYQVTQGSRWQADGGFSFNLIASKLILSAKYYDIFNTYLYKNTVFYNNYISSYTNDMNANRLKVNLIYRLNYGWKKARNGRGAGDEINRFKN